MISNRSLVLPYAAPFLGYVAIASLLGDHISTEVNYLFRMIVVIGALVWAWKWYVPMRGPKSVLISVVTGIVAGLVGTVVWVVLLRLFVDAADGESWSGPAFVLRLIAAGLFVPVFEEILMRGFVFRLAYQWGEARRLGEDQPLQLVLDEQTINTVPPGAWSWIAVCISTLVFASGHNLYEWPASIGFGLLMSLLWIVRKDLVVCIVAHSVTNITLALYVMKTGSWHLW
jgi:membrane protease YdiL (CAAX protease family)